MEIGELTKEGQANLFIDWLINKQGKSLQDAIRIQSGLVPNSAVRNAALNAFKNYLRTTEGDAWARASVFYQASGNGSAARQSSALPTISKVEPLNGGQIPVGGPAQLVVTYSSQSPFYMRLDLLPKFSWTSGGFWSPGSYAWVNGTWQYAEAGTNRQITLVFNSVPANWYPSNGVRALKIKIDASPSSDGAGDKQLLQADEVFWILDADMGTDVVDPIVGGTKKPDYDKTKDTKKTDSGVTDPGDDTGDAAAGTANTALEWLKKNWMIVALLGAFLLLAMPERSRGKDD